MQEFFIRCNPPKTTAQQKGAFVQNGQVRFFTKEKVKQAENLFCSLLLPFQPQERFKVPVCCDLCVVFPYRKAERKSLVNECVYIPHESNPDRDNFGKAFFDVMTRLDFWTDDSKVFGGELRKYWGAIPGIYVRIYTEAEEKSGGVQAFSMTRVRRLAETSGLLI